MAGENQNTKTIPFSSAPPDIGETGPQTDLSAAAQPAGTTSIDNGVARNIKGQTTGAANVTSGAAADAIDYNKLAEEAGGQSYTPGIDYNKLAAEAGGKPVDQRLDEVLNPEDQQKTEYQEHATELNGILRGWVAKDLIPEGTWQHLRQSLLNADAHSGIYEALGMTAPTPETMAVDPLMSLPENKTLAKVPLLGEIFKGGKAGADATFGKTFDKFMAEQTSGMNIALLGSGEIVGASVRAIAAVKAIKGAEEAVQGLRAVEAERTLR